ncbi:MAG: ribonuclease H-like domain-containing protein [Candidatus Niyogibacteria bacterium]|nr:MAG: ribonuclease H-like domain-containing protein [Candidatus Niyogibacteria bacterium]
MAKDIIIFDLETKKEFAEVGGREHPELLGVSVLGAYSYAADKYFIFEEKELSEFESMLGNAGLLIGFNIRGFDLPVLQPYVKTDLKKITALDMMDGVINAAGFRVSLDNLAKTTLGLAKSADGLEALEWFRQGRIQEVKDYCLKDVEVTKKLYEHGKEFGYVKFISRYSPEPETLKVDWSMAPAKDNPQLSLI